LILVETLQTLLMQDPQTATAIKTVCEQIRGQEGVELFRMLWGYTPQEMTDGAAATLIDYLDSNATDYRLLAFHNLREFKGGNGFYYRPEYEAAAKRRKEVTKWKEWYAKLKKPGRGPATPGAARAKRVTPPADDEPEMTE
jgi:hypothetical protein